MNKSGEIDQAYVLPNFIEHLPRHSLAEVRSYIEAGAHLELWQTQRECLCLMCMTARALPKAHVEGMAKEMQELAELPGVEALVGATFEVSR